MPPSRAALLLTACPLFALACGGGGSAKSSTGSGGATSSTTTSSGASTTILSTGGGGTGGSGPSCGAEGWLTYNHDARRTGASGGCVTGPLTTSWRYAPAPPSGKKLNAVFNAVAQPDAVFLAWSAQNDPYLGTTAADRVDATGARVWTFDSGTDSNLGNWPSVAFGGLVVNDDGLYFLDGATGKKNAGTGVDDWGQTLTDGTNLYAVNDSHVDGPGIYVGAYDATAKQIWAANKYGMCRIDAGDIAGGIALDGGVLFYAPSYSLGAGVMLGFASGVYAFDAASGKQSWFVAATPTSGISAGGGRVYLVEGSNELVARSQADGSTAWSATVMDAGTQAPVLAAGKVIVATASEIAAFDAATGAPAWTAPVTGGAAQAFDLMFSGGCVAGSGQWSGNAFGTAVATTTLAAATGSDTLLVTAADGIHLISLSTGAAGWSGKAPQAMGTVKNPVIVGHTVYVVDDSGLLALQGS